MTLDLSKVIFSNDVFMYEIEQGTLIFYNVNECIPTDNAKAPVKRVILSLEDADGEQKILSSVIGLTFEGFTLSSIEEELQGSVMTLDNIALCTLEIPDVG